MSNDLELSKKHEIYKNSSNYFTNTLVYNGTLNILFRLILQKHTIRHFFMSIKDIKSSFKDIQGFDKII